MEIDYSAINFTNITNEEFVGRWGGVDYFIKAGETKPFPEFLANHFAKHLADKILIKKNPKSFKSESLRQPLIERMLGQVKVEAVEQIVEEEVVEDTKKIAAKARMAKARAAKATKAKSPEEEFEGDIKE